MPTQLPDVSSLRLGLSRVESLQRARGHVIVTVVSREQLLLTANWLCSLAARVSVRSTGVVVALHMGLCEEISPWLRVHQGAMDWACVEWGAAADAVPHGVVRQGSDAYKHFACCKLYALREVHRVLLLSKRSCSDCTEHAARAWVWCSDVDVVFHRDPFSFLDSQIAKKLNGSRTNRLPSLPSMVVASECYHWYGRGMINTGVMALRADSTASALLDAASAGLAAGRTYDGTDQGALQAVVSMNRSVVGQLPCSSFGNMLSVVTSGRVPPIPPARREELLRHGVSIDFASYVAFHWNFIDATLTKRKCLVAAGQWHIASAAETEEGRLSGGRCGAAVLDAVTQLRLSSHLRVTECHNASNGSAVAHGSSRAPPSIVLESEG